MTSGTVKTKPHRYYASFNQDKLKLHFGPNGSISLSSENCNSTEDLLRTIAKNMKVQVFKVSRKVDSRIVNSAFLGNSSLQSRNLSTVFFVRSSSQSCPRTRQMSFSNNRAPTVNSATRPIGSNTSDTRLSTKLYVKELVTVLEVLQLTTRVSLLWSHFNPSTCKYSYSYKANTFGWVDCGDPLI